MIPFTQYLLPDGKLENTGFVASDEVEAKALAVIQAGYRFECEILRTDQVSLTVFDKKEEVDVEIEIVENGPGVPLAVARLVERAYTRISGV